jgi:type IV secretory pathway protease TraF
MKKIQAESHPANSVTGRHVKTSNNAALGFRAHSGWAAAVALAGSPRSPEVVDRRRIVLIEPGSPGGVQPYHAARAMDLPKAQEFIKRVIEAINSSASLAIRAFAEAISVSGHDVACCGIVLASGRALPSLEATLRSHAMVHAAEGELYRAAIARAAKNLKWRCVRVPERDLYKLAAKHLHSTEPKLKLRITEMGRSLGSPWSADEKSATLVAWLALTGFATS